MEVDPDDLSFDEMYRIMTTTIVPRPIGWISTTSADGIENVAPYSHFNTVCPSPPVVMFSAGYADLESQTLKDTPRNVLETGEFVVNLVTESVAQQMDETSAAIDREDSEFDFANLAKASSVRVRPPRVADASVALECSLYDSHEVYNNIVIFGEVEYVHIDDGVTTDGNIDMEKIDAVGRLGGPFYTSIDIKERLKRTY
jgi:flavin reductase (DIM6/NTAB) family NADH-FMN oxidoreductase RutF